MMAGPPRALKLQSRGEGPPRVGWGVLLAAESIRGAPTAGKDDGDPAFLWGGARLCSDCSLVSSSLRVSKGRPARLVPQGWWGLRYVCLWREGPRPGASAPSFSHSRPGGWARGGLGAGGWAHGGLGAGHVGTGAGTLVLNFVCFLGGFSSSWLRGETGPQPEARWCRCSSRGLHGAGWETPQLWVGVQGCRGARVAALGPVE